MQMAEPYSGRDTNDADLMEVLMALKANIMRDLHVGSFGIVKTMSPLRVSLFPQIEGEDDKTLDAENMAGELSVGQIVYVVFADRNFIQSLKQAKLGQKQTKLKNDAELHSQKYAVIIAKLNQED